MSRRIKREMWKITRVPFPGFLPESLNYIMNGRSSDLLVFDCLPIPYYVGTVAEEYQKHQ